MNSQHEPETIKIVVEEVSDSFRIFHTNFELTRTRTAPQPGSNLRRSRPWESIGNSSGRRLTNTTRYRHILAVGLILCGALDAANYTYPLKISSANPG